MDMQLVIDAGKLKDYMTKYVTKAETTSAPGVQRLFATLAKDDGPENPNSNDNSGVRRYLKKIMANVLGERSVSSHETGRINLSESFILSTHTFERINLDTSKAKMSLKKRRERKKRNSANDGENMVSKKTMCKSFSIIGITHNLTNLFRFSDLCFPR